MTSNLAGFKAMESVQSNLPIIVTLLTTAIILGLIIYLIMDYEKEKTKGDKI